MLRFRILKRRKKNLITFTNQASLSYNGTVTTSNVTTGQIITAITLTKTALQDIYSAGQTLTYVISLVNSSDSPFENLTLIDDLGAYSVSGNTVYPLSYTEGSARIFVNGVPGGELTVSDGQPLTITGINLPAQGNALIIYTAEVTVFAPPAAGGVITNTATVTGEGITTPITASETVGAEAEPILTITKELSPTVVQENGELTYTFFIRNFGNLAADESANAVITDTFDPALSDIEVTFNGESWREGVDYTYDERTGQFTSVSGQITVPAATISQNPMTGEWVITPGISILTVRGTI